MRPSQYTWIQEISQTKSDGTTLRLAYYLTRWTSEDLSTPLYGICVRKSEAEAGEFEETATPPISSSEDFVRQLLQHVITHAVTPLCLLEVLDELASRYEDQGERRPEDRP